VSLLDGDDAAFVTDRILGVDGGRRLYQRATLPPGLHVLQFPLLSHRH
jgi:hypothetical protein